MRRCTDILPSVIALAMLSISVGSMRAADDPLPSWNDGPARQAIVAFVAKVTMSGSPDFVPPAERIAVPWQRRASTGCWNWSWPRTRS
jgi:hypothetical protein